TVTVAIGAFLQQAAQAGTVFSDSTLSADVGSFFIQAAKDADGLLTSSFMGSAASFLTKAIAETVSLQATTATPTLLGTFLREMSQPSNSYAVFAYAGKDAANFLQQSATNDTNFLDPGFVNELEQLMPTTIYLTFVSEPPGGTSVGGTFSAAILARGTNGDDMAGVPVTVSLTTNTADADLHGTLTQTTNSQGLATFNDLSVDMPGTGYSLTASGAGSTPKSDQFDASATDPQLQQYVTAVYQGVLGRAPDPGGLVYWAQQLVSGVPFSGVAQSIGHSTEYYAHFIIVPAYLNLLGRPASAADVAYWTLQMQNGLTDQGLQAGFVASNEFYLKAGGNDKAWVDQVYRNLLRRPASSGDETYWTQQLAAGMSRGEAATLIANSNENDSQFIESDYESYLGRAPSQTDLNFWLQQLNDGETNEDVIADFTGSAEYYKDHAS
ncbi:MAG: DUF4214 domain-containing protein, partial [Pirellulales bacterium]